MVEVLKEGSRQGLVLMPASLFTIPFNLTSMSQDSALDVSSVHFQDTSSA